MIGIRGDQNAETFASIVRAIVAELDPALPLSDDRRTTRRTNLRRSDSARSQSPASASERCCWKRSGYMVCWRFRCPSDAAKSPSAWRWERSQTACCVSRA
jgi:hypothetical protein